MFCPLIDPYDSPSRRLLRWSHPCVSSRWRPLRVGGLLKTSSCLLKMWCQVIHRGWPEIYFLKSALLFEKCRRICRLIGNVASHDVPDERVSRVSSANAFLISIFLCEYEKSALFLLILLLPGGFVLMTFLFVHQSACFMNVLHWTVFVSLLGGEKKKSKYKQIQMN